MKSSPVRIVLIQLWSYECYIYRIFCWRKLYNTYHAQFCFYQCLFNHNHALSFGKLYKSTPGILISSFAFFMVFNFNALNSIHNFSVDKNVHSASCLLANTPVMLDMLVNQVCSQYLEGPFSSWKRKATLRASFQLHCKPIGKSWPTHPYIHFMSQTAKQWAKAQNKAL